MLLGGVRRPSALFVNLVPSNIAGQRPKTGAFGCLNESFEPALGANAVLYRETSQRDANEFLLAPFGAEQSRPSSGGVVRISRRPAARAKPWQRRAGFSPSECDADLDQLGCSGSSHGRFSRDVPRGTEGVFLEPNGRHVACPQAMSKHVLCQNKVAFNRN